MRLRTTTVLALGFCALTGCSVGSTSVAHPVPSTSLRADSGSAPASGPLSSAALRERLLDERDLGEGYTRKPEQPERHDDVTVTGCPALEKLGGDAATGSGLDFAHEAKASFAYDGNSTSAVGVELYSDSPAKLAKGISKVFDAMLSCPTYQVASGSTVVDVGTAASAAPLLGDERWSQLLTVSVGGRRSVVKQTAIRTGNILVLVSYAGSDLSLLRSRGAEERDRSAGVAGVLHPSWSAAAKDRMRLAA